LAAGRESSGPEAGFPVGQAARKRHHDLSVSDVSTTGQSQGLEDEMSVQTISPKELHERQQSGATVELIDVRTPVEFREVHAEPARNVPLDTLDPASVMGARNGSADEPLYVICRSDSRGKKACERFQQAGYANVWNVAGGTIAWDDLGLPVVRGRKAISLERQVRIAAGFLALLGAVLALAVHPWFAGLSAFVGAGLMFAGITDTCGMAMLLARMPWNQVKRESSCSTGVGR
jgi:rhodanese-related sulfurtransferase